MNIKQDRRQIYPIYSKQKINNSAKNIAKDLIEHDGIISSDDEKLVENWRASHTHVLNTWQVILRDRIKKNKGILFAQRLKRKNTIYDKLKRFPDMEFTRMHDIAGCRLVFNKETDMRNYINKLHNSNFKHVLKESQCKDYITNPKETGYRGIHDVYAYKSKYTNDGINKWDGLLVEIQYRTIYQHAWATAVEIADYLNNCRTKYNQGDEKQREFFKYASEIIARVYENKKSCKSSLTNQELVSNFKKLENEIHLLQKLKQINAITRIPVIRESKTKHNLIIHFIIKNEHFNSEIEGFKSLSKANSRYFELEKQYPNDDIVLVKSNNIKNILEVYRNYFANTKDFTSYIDEGLIQLIKN